MRRPYPERMTTAADSTRRTPRTVRAAVVAAIDEARNAGRLKAWHEPDAAVALRLAGALGKRGLPNGELVRLSSALRLALGALPLRPEGAPPADGEADPDEPDDVDRELAEIVGSGPTVGDTAHA